MNIEPTNLPAAFAERMQKLLNTDYNDFTRALKETSPTSIRQNSRKATLRDDLPNVPWCASGKYLAERPIFTLDPAIHGGAYYVQEASSMFLEQALIQAADLNQSLNVLDLCAAPGGKSTHLLSLISKDSLLISNEVIRSRAPILSENIQKWGSDNVIVTNNDPGDFQNLKGFFDVIVVDAPCSGEGLFRKDVEAMKEWSPENVELCWKRQRRILSDVWPALKSGGILIYSTCTYNPLENEENLVWLKAQYNAEFISLKTKPEWGISEVKENNIIGYHFYPHQVKGEGFFISAIRKTNDQESIRMKIKKRIFHFPKPKITDPLNEWISNPQDKQLLTWKENILMVPIHKLEAIEFVTQQLHIISTGTTLCEIKHEKLIPDHAFALSLHIQKDQFIQLELTKAQALQYLRKDVLQISGEKKGFALVTYEGLSLGWVNVLDNRINNMYPANWRIRMAG